MHLRSLIALSLIFATGTATAAVAPMACPDPTHQQTALDPTADQDAVTVDLYQGTTLVSSASMASLVGRWTPFAVSREQAYTASLRTDHKAAKTLVTPGVASEGLRLMVRSDPVSADLHTVSYAITLSKIDTMITAGPAENRITVAQQTKSGPFCGQVALKNGESETFPLNQDGLVARITRRAIPATPVASVP